MKEKYFRPIVTNSTEMTNASLPEPSPVPLYLVALAARKLMDETVISKKDGFKILEKK